MQLLANLSSLNVSQYLAQLGLSTSSYTSLAVLAVATVVLVLLVRRLLFSSGGVRDRSRARLMQTSYDKSQVESKVNEYVEYYESGDRSAYDKNINQFYNLVTDFYEYGWGQSFHFAVQKRGQDFQHAILEHERRIANDLGLRPGSTCVDMGCGVGGPLRNIARMSGASIKGVTISEYQVKRANQHIQEQNMGHLCSVQQGDFLKLPFADNTFDGAYAIEATCHAPKLEDVYREAFRVLKPGARFVTYEWVVTDKYDAHNPEHKAIVDEINKCNGLPDMRSTADCVPIAESVGFRTVSAKDLVFETEVAWYQKLTRGKLSHAVTHIMCWVMEKVGFAPKGTVATSSLLLGAARSLVRGGQLGIFTPFFYCVFEKPAK